MKLLLCLIAIFSWGQVLSQSESRTITVNGHAEKKIMATGMNITLTISELQPNDYARTGYVPFEAAYTGFLEELLPLGVHENKLEPNSRNIPRYSPTESREYSLELPDIQLAEKVLAIKAPGVQFANVMYTFPAVDDAMEASMAKEALRDAKERANLLAKDLNVKVGKVLTIQSHNGSFRNNYQNANSKTNLVEYNVEVAFEIVDP